MIATLNPSLGNYQSILHNQKSFAKGTQVFHNQSLSLKINAQIKKALLVHSGRNQLSQVLNGRGNLSHEHLSFFHNKLGPNKHEINFVNLIKKIAKNEDSQKISKAFLNLQKVFLDQNSINPEKTNQACGEFFKQLMELIPNNKQLKAQACLNSMTNSSAQLVNALDLNSDTINEFQNTYFNSIESFIEILFDKSEKNSDMEEFKNTILSAAAISGFYLTYEKKSWDVQAAVFAKKSLFSVAYTLGAISGVLLTTFLSPFLSPIILFAVGSLCGYLITVLLEHGAEKCLHNAQKQIENAIKINCDKTKKYWDKSLSKNTFEMNPHESLQIRNIFKDLLVHKNSSNNFLQNFNGNANLLPENKYVTLKNKFINLKNTTSNFSNYKMSKTNTQELKHLIKELIPNEQILNEFYYALHICSNCPNTVSSTELKNLENKIMDCLNEYIPHSFMDEKNSILKSLAYLSLNYRDIKLSFLKKSDAMIYFLFDSLVDFSGMSITQLLHPLLAALPHFSALALDFLSSFFVGFIPAGLGILVYFGICSYILNKEQNSVYLPNLALQNEIVQHKKNQLQILQHSISFAQNTPQTELAFSNNETIENLNAKGEIIGDKEYIHNALVTLNNRFENKFIGFRILSENEGQLKMEYHCFDEIQQLPNNYLIFPLTVNNTHTLKEQKLKLENELII